MDNLIFRNSLRASDLAAIAEITRSTGFFEGVEGEIECAVADAEDCLTNGAAASGSEYILAELNGEVVAFVSFGPTAVTDNTWFLYWISVHQSLRGKGVGRRLMECALSKIFSLGARKAFLQTSCREQYAPTRAFYLSMGFTQEAILKDYYKDGEDTVYYSMLASAFELKLRFKRHCDQTGKQAKRV